LHLIKEIKILDIKQSMSKDLIESLYKLNQENTPEVGSLSSINTLQELINMSSDALYFSKKNKVIGFIICLREKKDYQSLNYKFFSKLERKFLYIDRVVVEKGNRNKGIGKYVYQHLFDTVKKYNIPVCCEVNIQPINKVSLDFHSSLGFKQVGEYSFKTHSVAYLRKFAKS
jgi:predicted GNAT superfamily acetyltransferase